MEVVKIDTGIAEAFKINITEVQDMVEKYQELTLIPEDEDSYKICRVALTSCIRVRTGIDKRRKELNSKAQNEIKARNTAAKQLTAIIEPAETHLSALVKGEDNRIKAIEAEKEKRQQEIIQGRVDELMKINCIMPFMEIATLSDEEYAILLQGQTQIYAGEQERLLEEAEALKAENDRIEKIRKEQEAEAERLAEIQAEIEKKQEAKNKRFAEIQVEIEAKEKALKDEQDKYEAEKKADQERKDREEFERKAKEKAEIQEKKDAEAKIEREAKEKVEREKAEAEEAAKQEALKPDKEKLFGWLSSVSSAIDNCPADIENKIVFNKAIDFHTELTGLIFSIEKEIGKL